MYRNGVALALAGGLVSALLSVSAVVLDRGALQTATTLDATYTLTTDGTTVTKDPNLTYDPYLDTSSSGGTLTDTTRSTTDTTNTTDPTLDTTLSTYDSTQVQPTTDTSTTLTSTTDTTATTKEVYQVCPFKAATNRMIIDYTERGTRSVRELTMEANSTREAADQFAAASIPRGEYKVQLASFGSPLLSVNDSASSQRWFLELYGSASTPVARSNASSDIGGTERMVTELVGTIKVSDPVTKAIARHQAYPSKNAEPVAPLCAALDLVVSTGSLSPTDTVTVETTDLSTVTDDAELIYASCPISSKEGRTIVDFTKGGTIPTQNLIIRSDGDRLAAARGPLATYIPRGTYEVRYASMHKNRTGEEGNAQGWFARLYDADGGILVQVPSVLYVPFEDKAYSEFVRKVEKPITIERAVTRLTAQHSAYPNSLPNDFAVLCVTFDKVGSLALKEPVLSDNEAPKLTDGQKEPVNDNEVEAETATAVPAVRTNDEAPLAVVRVLQQPDVVGIDGGGNEVEVPEYIIEQRTRVVEELEDTPFNVLKDASQGEREEVVRKLLTQATVAATSATSTTEPPAITLVRRSLEEDERSPSAESERTDDAEEQIAVLKERQGLLRIRDTDGDGVSDFDETSIYKTDPNNPFTASGVLSDGERVLLGLDPTTQDTEPVPVESPRSKGTVVPYLFSVDTIELVESPHAISPDDPQIDMLAPEPGTTSTFKPVRIAGTTEPFSFITLYIYSTPVVITVQADAAGRYEYTLDTTLEDGSHEVYVANVDNSGKILAKSDAIPFVKTAEAIEYTPLAAQVDPVESSVTFMLVLGGILLFALMIGGIVWIGIARTRRNALGLTAEHHEEA